MATIPTIYEDPDSYDTITIGGLTLPGCVRVPDMETARDFDVKKAKGKAKAKVTNNGDPPREAEFEWDVNPEKDWDRYDEAWTLLQPRKDGKDLQPLEIVHPIYARHQFRTALIKSLSGPRIERGVYKHKVKLLEYEKPKPAGGVSGTGKGGSSAQADWNLQKLVHELEVVEAELAQLKIERSGIASSGSGFGTNEVLLKIDARIQALSNRRSQLLAQMQKPNADAKKVA